MTSMLGVVVEYKAKTDQYDIASRRVSKSLDNLKTQQKSVESGFTKMSSSVLKFGSILGGLGLGIIATSIKSIADEMGDLHDQAEKVGISIGKLQELSLVAKEAGVSQDTLTNSLFKMTKSLGDASLGSKPVIDALKTLGLSLEDLKKLDAQQQFVLISSKLRDVSDDGIRASLAMTFLGKSSKDLAGLLKTNLAESIDEVHKLNFALTDMQGKNLDKLSESIDRLWTTSKSRLAGVVADLTPAIFSLGNMLQNSAQKTSDILVKGINEWLRGVNAARQVVDSKFQRDVKGTELLLRGINRWSGGALNSISDQSLHKSLPSVFGNPNGGTSGTAPASSIAPIPALANFGSTVTNAISSVKEFSSAIINSTDAVSSKFESLNNKAVNDQIERIFNNVETRSSVPKYIANMFDKLGGEIISDIKSGADPNGAKVMSKFKTLSSWATQNANAGYDASGELGAVRELKKYLEKLGSQTQTVDVNIKIEPNDKFWIEWSTKPEVKKNIVQQIVETTAQAAKMGAK